MTPTIGALLAHAEQELRAPGRNILTNCPLTWAWLCEVLVQLERHTPEGLSARAKNDPDAWASHVAYHTEITISQGNVNPQRLLGMIAEWYFIGTDLEPRPGQRMDQYLRDQQHALALRIIDRMYSPTAA